MTKSYNLLANARVEEKKPRFIGRKLHTGYFRGSWQGLVGVGAGYAKLGFARKSVRFAGVLISHRV